MVKDLEKKFYLPIDGLRAMCFLLVFLFHCNFPGFQMGWVGVSIFFTISGFLITEILIKSKSSKNYFKAFYLRRLLRIFPIYYALIFAAAIIFIVTKGKMPSDLGYDFFYLQNFLWTKTNYVSDLQSILAHTWSLAIEEQFYLFWPALIFFIPNNKVWILCVGSVLVSIVFRLVMLFYFTEYRFASTILLPSQLDLLALGGLLTCYKNDLLPNKWVQKLVINSLPIGLVGIVITIFVIGYLHGDYTKGYDLLKIPDGYIHHPFTLQIFLFIGFVSIGIIKLCIATKETPFSRVFSHSYLVHLGKISYGLYLYHWPLLLITRMLISNKYLIPFIALALTIIVSEVSFRFFEKKFNALKAKFNY
jgi:peptidoglycan/LPS O-acetylase OafA/YrhL